MHKLIKKLHPLAYSVWTFHYMIKEFFLLPQHLKIQRKDWNVLSKKYPKLTEYYDQKDSIQSQLKDAYHDYVSNYSASLISLSLKKGTFLYFFCHLTKPKIVLDLGTGFSSYVFRLFDKNEGATEVISVDESEYWLNETKEFLQKYNLSTEGMLTWEEYEYEQLPDFDLTFVDIGNFNFRLRILPILMIKIKKFGGVIIVDDFHMPFYRTRIKRMCKKMGLDIFSLRSVTRTRLNHNALICPRY
jgi:predicted O-methyltransferase YrrM